MFVIWLLMKFRRKRNQICNLEILWNVSHSQEMMMNIFMKGFSYERNLEA